MKPTRLILSILLCTTLLACGGDAQDDTSTATATATSGELTQGIAIAVQPTQAIRLSLIHI